MTGNPISSARARTASGRKPAYRAGNDRDAGRLHAPPGLGLVAHRADGGRRGAHENKARLLDRLGERRALGEEAVSRVHRVGAGPARGVDQSVDVEIALGRRGAADRHGMIGGADVWSGTVGVGVDGHGLEAFLVTGADDA